ncbi:MAG: GTP-binding protein, partial [Thermoplasmata archaeon]
TKSDRTKEDNIVSSSSKSTTEQQDKVTTGAQEKTTIDKTEETEPAPPPDNEVQERTAETAQAQPADATTVKQANTLTASAQSSSSSPQQPQVAEVQQKAAPEAVQPSPDASAKEAEKPAVATPPVPAGPPISLNKKIILIGDGGCGKTTLIRKFVHDMFDDKYIHTIGTKVSKKTVDYPEENVNLTLMIWDVQGQKNVLHFSNYFKGAEGALIVCDTTRRETLDHLPDWIIPFYETAGEVPIILLANKWDLEDQRQFGIDEVKFMAKKVKTKLNTEIDAYVTSAKTGLNVEKAFRDLGKLLIKEWRQSKK